MVPTAFLLELAKAPAAVHEHSRPISPGSGTHNVPVNSMLCPSTVRQTVCNARHQRRSCRCLLYLNC